MYDNKELKRSSKSLYNDIDACISDIIKARLQKDNEAEGRALFKMESLMVATLQQLSCIIDYLGKDQTDDNVRENQTAIKAVKNAMLEWIEENKNYSSGPSWALLKTHIETL